MSAEQSPAAGAPEGAANDNKKRPWPLTLLKAIILDPPGVLFMKAEAGHDDHHEAGGGEHAGEHADDHGASGHGAPGHEATGHGQDKHHGDHAKPAEGGGAPHDPHDPHQTPDAANDNDPAHANGGHAAPVAAHSERKAA